MPGDFFRPGRTQNDNRRRKNRDGGHRTDGSGENMNKGTASKGLLALAGIALAFAGGCKTLETKPAAPLLSGYTCCNFHYEKDWINDGNYAQLPFIPAGTPIAVKEYGSYRAHVDIDGKPFRLGLDYGRTAETTEQWVAKLIVQDDPKAKLATYPAKVREAIEAGRIMLGMTKEQVVMSLGHPLTSENPRLDAPFWRYWWSSFGEYQVHWNAAGRVSKVEGHAQTVALMLAPGNAAPAPAAAPATAPAPAAAPAPKKKPVQEKKRANTGGK